MPENPDNRDKLDSLRTEIERQQLELNKLVYVNESTRTYLQRWQTDVFPILEAAERSREFASGFAQTGIKSLYLLNGGALIAFSAFAQLVDTKLNEQIVPFILSVGAFVGGLILISISVLLAFISSDSDNMAARKRAEVVSINLNKSQNPEGHTQEHENTRIQADKERKVLYQSARKHARWGLGLAVASIAAFAIGATLAAWVLSSAATHADDIATSVADDTTATHQSATPQTP